MNAFVVGLSDAVLFGYLFLIMKDKMHSSKTIMGLSILIGSFSQICMFPLAHKVIHFLKGPINCIIISIFTYGVRLLIISYVTNPFLVFPMQLLHGVCDALFWVAAIQHTQDISPKDIRVTMYTIIANVYHNIAGVVRKTFRWIPLWYIWRRCCISWCCCYKWIVDIRDDSLLSWLAIHTKSFYFENK